MEYTPEEVQRLGLVEKPASQAGMLTGPAIIRRLPLTDRRVINGELQMTTSALPAPMCLAADHPMQFGAETIEAREYFKRVIEKGDLVDAAIYPQENGGFPTISYWIHIDYIGTPSAAGWYSKKDDGLFAMRAKAGEKAERRVTNLLRDEFGHQFPSALHFSPGVFQIYYKGKRQRKPDRICLTCGLTVEVKKRNKDYHYRVSHSSLRPFASENDIGPLDWHAFVFPDMSMDFVPNALIAQAIANNQFTPGSDNFDSWADVDGAVSHQEPPSCRPNNNY